MEDVLALMASSIENLEDTELKMDFFECDLGPEMVADLDEYLAISASMYKKPTCKPILSGRGLPPVSGTCSITIRVPAWVVRAYKTHATETGVRYQTQMNRVLRAGLDSHV